MSSQNSPSQQIKSKESAWQASPPGIISLVGLIDAITSVAPPRCLDDCDEWCAGMPLSSIRMLDSSELVLLRQQVSAQFSWQRGVSIASAFAFASTYIATILFPNPVDFSIMTCAASLMGVFVVWLLTDSGSWLRRFRALQMDLLSGVVHCFRDKASGRDLEVLPSSEVVFSGISRIKKWRRIELVSVAKTPPISSIASDWLLPIRGAVGTYFSGKRNLSSAEREEIRRWADQVIDHRRCHAVSYVCWAVLLAWLSRIGAPDLFYAALVLTGYAGSKICADIQLFLSLKRDAIGGTVIINCRATVKNGDWTPVGHPSEYLPTARVKWTDGGTPAGWRKKF